MTFSPFLEPGHIQGYFRNLSEISLKTTKDLPERWRKLVKGLSTISYRNVNAFVRNTSKIWRKISELQSELHSIRDYPIPKLSHDYSKKFNAARYVHPIFLSVNGSCLISSKGIKIRGFDKSQIFVIVNLSQVYSTIIREIYFPKWSKRKRQTSFCTTRPRRDWVSSTKEFPGDWKI